MHQLGTVSFILLQFLIQYQIALKFPGVENYVGILNEVRNVKRSADNNFRAPVKKNFRFHEDTIQI